MDYIVAIPSYNRSKSIIDNTLHTLLSKKVPAKKIYIFVANSDEYNEYKKVIPKEMYHKIVIGIIGLRNQRNFITDYFLWLYLPIKHTTPNGKS